MTGLCLGVRREGIWGAMELRGGLLRNKGHQKTSARRRRDVLVLHDGGLLWRTGSFESTGLVSLHCSLKLIKFCIKGLRQRGAGLGLLCQELEFGSPMGSGRGS